MTKTKQKDKITANKIFFAWLFVVIIISIVGLMWLDIDYSLRHNGIGEQKNLNTFKSVHLKMSLDEVITHIGEPNRKPIMSDTLEMELIYLLNDGSNMQLHFSKNTEEDFFELNKMTIRTENGLEYVYDMPQIPELVIGKGNK